MSIPGCAVSHVTIKVRTLDCHVFNIEVSLLIIGHTAEEDDVDADSTASEEEVANTDGDCSVHPVVQTSILIPHVYTLKIYLNITPMNLKN